MNKLCFYGDYFEHSIGKIWQIVIVGLKDGFRNLFAIQKQKALII